MQKPKNHIVIFTFGALFILISVWLNHHFSCSIRQIAENASEKIKEKEVLSSNALNLMLHNSLNTNFEDLFEKEDIGLYHFKNDTLIYWNNAQISFLNDTKLFKKEAGIIKLKQGYYLYVKKQIKNSFALALCLIKPNYDFQNNYLKNYFVEWTGIPKEIDISTNGLKENAITIQNQNLFFLLGSDVFYSSPFICNLGFVLFFTGFIVLLVAILLMVKVNKKPLFVCCIIIISFSFRILMIWLKWPDFFYKSSLYNVQLFGNAQSLINVYLGDIVLNAVFTVFICVIVHLCFVKSNVNSKNNFSLFILAFLIGYVVVVFNNTIVSLVTNSTLNFDFLSIFNIKFPAFVALFALTCYCIALFILINKLKLFFKGPFLKNFALYLSLVLAICVVIDFGFKFNYFFENYWLLIFAGCSFILEKIKFSKNPLGIGLQVLIMSVISSLFFNFYIHKNQELDLNLLSFSLGERKDAVLESEFTNVPKKILNDNKLKVLLEFLPNSEKEVEQSLKQNFFGGYFNRYNIEFSIFDKQCKPLLTVKDPLLLNEGFFEDQIKYNQTDSISENLFFINGYKKKSRYIAKITLDDKNIYLRLEPKQFEELGSFPDLLLDQSQQKPEKLKKFSHAVYRSGQITSRYGDFNYPYFMSDSLSLAKSNSSYKHYYFSSDEETQIIISQKVKTWNYYFTYNSYLFLFFSFISYLSYRFYELFFSFRVKSSSFANRIQSIIIMLLLLAITAVGITSVKLVSNQFLTDNIKQLQEKTQTIINELASQFTPQEIFNASQKELINLKLKEYAHLFNTDISLFNKDGKLFDTSEPRLYDLGLASSLVNPIAYNSLIHNNTSAISVSEKAGELTYLSLYTPLFNANKNLIGFVNLPYYAKQTDLVNELSEIISAFINVYVILFVISILSGLILTSYITRPLQLIKQQIANINLTRHNDAIKWKSNDEIGKLVNEYNQMLVKLEESANLLAQSERESAWREMAKQVAHEIKNPLTPMKLNLQYLQHLLKNQSEDFNEKFEKATTGIIEQIDSLANIANEFSSFAKFPKTNLQSINLSEIIGASVHTFSNAKNILIRNLISDQHLIVSGDKDQILRIFNNVLKNAVQALELAKEPFIEITKSINETSYIIAIYDNGCGIDDAMKQKLFTPNFTTKNTGSGLGLAMVKNSIQGFGGKVWIESEFGIGTTVYLEFLKVK